MIKINDELLKIEKFPNNELKIKEFGVLKQNKIVLKWESDQDLINLMFVKDHIDYNSSEDTITELYIPYFPYSRMDRKIEGDLFTLKSICKFIDNMNFDKVTTCDLHSDIPLYLINNIVDKKISLNLFKYLKNQLRYEIDYVLYPDQGAVNRYFIENQKYVVGDKVRNLQTGRIVSYDIEGTIKEGSNVCIIDDLSSYGGTFIQASKKLKEMGAKNVILIVTHCENSILDGDIFKTDDIHFVLTTNTIIDISKENDRLVILDIFNQI